ncbi:TPA: hypothetical protein DDZ86_03470 [Candidatus Dependentiae bacterium]|nr:MAG: hypothetical protein UW09_C0003G0047 [candidate division TM6 bacterium GW2011_GWF2_43_87]HBL98675.1 hypothetical protein [Candidatus Dependentiae bacterium]
MKNHLTIFWCIAIAGLLPLAHSLRANDCCGGCGCSNSTDTNSVSSCCSSAKTLWFPRSAGDNLVLDQHRLSYEYHEECCTYGNFGVAYRYQQSTKGRRIAEGLFGGSGLSFAGSQATSRLNKTVKASTLLADNFGLSHVQDNLSISLCPKVQNHIVDFKLYARLDNLVPGLFMQIKLPMVHTNWKLSGKQNKCCPGSCFESCCNSSCCDSSCATSATSCSVAGCQTGTLNSTPFPAGYMSNLLNETIAPVSSLSDALNGIGFGDFQGRAYGKFSGCHEATRLAGVYFDLGYNFMECPNKHCGFYLKVVAPTGTDMNSTNHLRNIFHPVVGDDHWQLGAGISGHTELYNCNDCHSFAVYLQGYVVHMFDRNQVRAFDLVNGPMSRYMLMKEFKSATDLSYNNKLWSVIDWSARRAKIHVDVKGEGLIEFVYKNDCGFSAGIGYEIYGRSREKLCKLCMPYNSIMSGKVLGLKGCAPVYAPGYTFNGANFVGNGVATGYNVSATQSNATPYVCGPVDNARNVSDPNPITGTTANLEDIYVNPLTFAQAGANPTVAELNNAVLQESSGPIITISHTTHLVTNAAGYRKPTLLTDTAINPCSGALGGYFTNKIFGHLDYVWEDHCRKPTLYAGAEGEFGRCEDKNAMNAWGVWIGGALRF